VTALLLLSVALIVVVLLAGWLIVQIVKARVHLNGLEPARDGFGTTSAPRTVVVPPTS
jgi:hypothetical protein